MSITLFPSFNRSILTEDDKANPHKSEYETYTGIVFDTDLNKFTIITGKFRDKKDMYEKMTKEKKYLRRAYESKIWDWIQDNAETPVDGYLMLSTAVSKWINNNVLSKYYKKLLHDLPYINREGRKGDPQTMGTKESFESIENENVIDILTEDGKTFDYNLYREILRQAEEKDEVSKHEIDIYPVIEHDYGKRLEHYPHNDMPEQGYLYDYLLNKEYPERAGEKTIDTINRHRFFNPLLIRDMILNYKDYDNRGYKTYKGYTNLAAVIDGNKDNPILFKINTLSGDYGNIKKDPYFLPDRKENSNVSVDAFTNANNMYKNDLKAIEELENKLNDPDLSTEELMQLKNKLKSAKENAEISKDITSRIQKIDNLNFDFDKETREKIKNLLDEKSKINSDNSLSLSERDDKLNEINNEIDKIKQEARENLSIDPLYKRLEEIQRDDTLSQEEKDEETGEILDRIKYLKGVFISQGNAKNKEKVVELGYKANKPIHQSNPKQNGNPEGDFDRTMDKQGSVKKYLGKLERRFRKEGKDELADLAKSMLGKKDPTSYTKREKALADLIVKKLQKQNQETAEYQARANLHNIEDKTPNALKEINNEIMNTYGLTDDKMKKLILTMYKTADKSIEPFKRTEYFVNNLDKYKEKLNKFAKEEKLKTDLNDAINSYKNDKRYVNKYEKWLEFKRSIENLPEKEKEEKRKEFPERNVISKEGYDYFKNKVEDDFSKIKEIRKNFYNQDLGDDFENIVADDFLVQDSGDDFEDIARDSSSPHYFKTKQDTIKAFINSDKNKSEEKRIKDEYSLSDEQFDKLVTKAEKEKEKREEKTKEDELKSTENFFKKEKRKEEIEDEKRKKRKEYAFDNLDNKTRTALNDLFGESSVNTGATDLMHYTDNLAKIEQNNAMLEDKTNGELNQDLFDGKELKEEIRQAMLKIADKFKEKLKSPIQPDDIYFTGSEANYNYNENSDIDIHLVYDFEQVGEMAELLSKYLQSVKRIFNDSHNITIKDIPVEVGVENKAEPLITSGIYSLISNSWIKEPENANIEIEEPEEPYVDEIKMQIEDAISEKNKEKLEGLIQMIWNMRKEGLEREGEFGPSNTLFKNLRASGLLQRLKNAYYDAESENLSLESISEAEFTDKNKSVVSEDDLINKSEQEIADGLIEKFNSPEEAISKLEDVLNSYDDGYKEKIKTTIEKIKESSMFGNACRKLAEKVINKLEEYVPASLKDKILPDSYANVLKDIANVDEMLQFAFEGIHPNFKYKKPILKYTNEDGKDIGIKLTGIEKGDNPKNVMYSEIKPAMVDGRMFTTEEKNKFMPIDEFLNVINSPKNEKWYNWAMKGESENPDDWVEEITTLADRFNNAYKNWVYENNDRLSLDHYPHRYRVLIYDYIVHRKWPEKAVLDKFKGKKQDTPVVNLLKGYKKTESINEAWYNSRESKSDKWYLVSKHYDLVEKELDKLGIPFNIINVAFADEPEQNSDEPIRYYRIVGIEKAGKGKSPENFLVKEVDEIGDDLQWKDSDGKTHKIRHDFPMRINDVMIAINKSYEEGSLLKLNTEEGASDRFMNAVMSGPTSKNRVMRTGNLGNWEKLTDEEINAVLEIMAKENPERYGLVTSSNASKDYKKQALKAFDPSVDLKDFHIWVPHKQYDAPKYWQNDPLDTMRKNYGNK